MNITTIRLRWLYMRGVFWWMGLAFTLIGTAVLLVVFTLWQGEEGFAANALQVGAKVTGKKTHIEKTGKKGTTPRTAYLLVYTYQDSARQEHEGSAEVSAQTWGDTKSGDDLTIEYDRTNPASSRLAGSEKRIRWGLWGMTGLGSLFATAGVLMAGSVWIASGRRVQRIRTGMPAVGVVEAVVENDSALKVPNTYRVLYQFTDERNATWKGRGPPQAWSRTGRWKAGDVILVLYDPQNPDRNEADLFEVRSEELAALQEQTEGDAATD